jgi:hypothetical protein
MELLRDSIPMVSLAVFVAALYSRAASSHLRPGVPRLAALLPVVAFLAAVPLAFAYSAILRGVAAFFFTWLTALKVALLSAGRGPLDPDLPVLPFVFTATLPIKLARRPGPGAGETAMSPKSKSSSSLVSCAVNNSVRVTRSDGYKYEDDFLSVSDTCIRSKLKQVFFSTCR